MTRTEQSREGVVAVGNHRTLYAVAGAAVAAQVAGYLASRPALLRWGTQAGESIEPLPGDDLVPNPRVQSTRAITIDTPPEQVWPWIVQMGIGRAGLHTHDRVERLMFHTRPKDPSQSPEPAAGGSGPATTAKCSHVPVP